ncbi:PAS domain S-box protein [Undibacterium fentianense]|uniref:Sensory/regulatory protein RpfC n=1 Tax=Undibacterium fentianense TaxID=2828728 RepID=A0A941E179_9BURK|nr:PAS domain S-box protein [Undibacterium fentianense]MBR7799387.1 PAS domain S-box protein [Undibacterium fentianense]
MAHKLATRQFKRLLGIQNEEQLALVLDEFDRLKEGEPLSDQALTVVRGMRQFFSQVEEAYEQADRDLALGKRSLELSSEELTNANITLRHEAEMRRSVMQTLRDTTNEVLAQLGKRLADEESLENLSTLLAGLVVEILNTRSELQNALAAIKNQQFALDEHAIVSITNASGDIIYANDKFCEISQYAREELIGVNHRIVNSALHSKDFFQGMWNTISSGKVWHGEIRNQAKDKSFYWTNATIVPFLDENQIPYQFISIRTDITHERFLKDEIASRERLLKNIMNTLGEGVYTLDADGRCTFVNPEAEKILGWTFDEMRGQTLHDLIHSMTLHGDHVDREDCPITHAVGQGEVFRSDNEYFQHKSGRLLPISIVASPIFEDGKILGSVAAFQDISARRAADEALRESENKQRMMLDNAADAVFVAGKDERWAYVNDLATQMLGYQRDELIGMSIYDTLPETHREVSRRTFAGQLAESKLIRQEIRLVRKDGKHVPVEMNAALLPDGSIYGSCRDITSRKEFESALIQAKMGAESASRAKSEFLATMSHEIRTPMNGIIGMTELALDTDLQPQQREYLDLVKVSSHALLGIINDILDFSKIESGKLVLENIEFPLRELIATTLKSLALRAEERDLELVYRIDPSIPDLLIGDPGKLRQVLTNLVGNAIKFSESGDISVEINRAGAESNLGEMPILFSVKDCGIGIPKEKLEHIFEPFSQADASTTRKYGGTGLGLSISSRLVQSMQGELQVESESGLGSRFYFNAIFGVSRAEKQFSAPIEFKGMRVLVVDDNAINRQYLLDTLMNWQMSVQLADSAAKGILVVTEMHDKHAPADLILLDVCMPEMDGFSFVESLQKQGLVGTTKILMLSSAAGHDDVQHCEALQIDGYVRKPLSQQELQSSIDAIMRGLPSGAMHYSVVDPAPVVTARDKLNILLVEDNLINQRLALSLLEKWGHHADVAENGIVGIEKYQSQAYDLILMDMQMPEMGGIEATQIIRSLESNGQHIPIIAMTANAMPGDRERCLEAGMDHYLSKPIKSESLRELLSSLMSTNRIERRPSEPAQTIELEATPRATDEYGLKFDFFAAIHEGDTEVLDIIAPMFLEGCDKMTEEVQLALDRHDAELLYRSAHTLKGLVANFNARPIEELARALEQKGKNADFSRTPIIFEQVVKQMPSLKSAIRRYLKIEN